MFEDWLRPEAINKSCIFAEDREQRRQLGGKRIRLVQQRSELSSQQSERVVERLMGHHLAC